MRIARLVGWIIFIGGTSLAREIWLDVPFVHQSREGCGSACIAMVIQYWDRNSSASARQRENEPNIYRRLYSPEVKGITESAMERYLEAQGFRVFAFRGNWQDLQTHLSKGRPLIVCLKNGSAHYTVVCGIDAEEGVIRINDPARRKLLEISRVEFEKGWQGSGNWTLLALPS